LGAQCDVTNGSATWSVLSARARISSIPRQFSAIPQVLENMMEGKKTKMQPDMVASLLDHAKG
jgi:hypothetical protein